MQTKNNDVGKWFITTDKQPFTFKSCFEEENKRYKEIADYFGVDISAGVFREIDFLESLVKKLKKLDKQYEKNLGL